MPTHQPDTSPGRRREARQQVEPGLLLANRAAYSLDRPGIREQETAASGCLPSPQAGRIVMAEPLVPDVVVNVCHDCIPDGERLPRQWEQGGGLVVVREIPCSGKIDVQYLFHGIEGGGKGLCVVACPKGQCTLAEGNYRAEIRVRTVQRLLGEMGIESARVELLHCSPDDQPDHLERLVRDAVRRFGVLGDSPIRRSKKAQGSPTKG